jgi:hypothetical protein
MEEGRTTEKTNDFEGEVGTALEPTKRKLPSTEFVKVEKNLASLGFFTPSSKRTRNEKSKTITATVVVDGKRIEAKATIAPTALFGLPITADQDKWLALNKILVDVQTREGQVTNPVSFSSAELLALLQIYKDSGKNYRDVSDWLDVMVGTTIISEGAVYFAGKKTFGKDVYHVFDRAVSFGKQLPDGSIADKNYVWLSQWQLQNINNHHQLPIDLDAYRQLKNYTSKALVPLLQVWLFATRDDGVFEKRYDELCQILNIRQWNYPSKIKEKFGASLDELKRFGYLSDWKLEETSDKHSHKILFFHGEKFHSDRRARLNRMPKSNSVAELKGRDHPVVRRQGNNSAVDQPIGSRESLPVSLPVFDRNLVAEFTRRGINEKKAYELLANLKPGQHQNLVAQLEHAEQVVQRSQFPITNPAGFIIRLIERNTPVPDGFETSAKRKAREGREEQQRRREAEQRAQQDLETEYDWYRTEEIDHYITTVDPAEVARVLEAKRQENRTKHTSLPPDMIDIFAQGDMKREFAKRAPLMTIEEFSASRGQEASLLLKQVPDFATAEAAIPEPVAIISLPEEAAIDRAGRATAADPPATIEESGEPTPLSPSVTPSASSEPTMKISETPETEPATPPTISEPTIELASEPPHPEPSSDAISP